MGCVFEAAKEQPQKPRSKQPSRHPCRGSRGGAKAAGRANNQTAEDIEIKDNYQQNRKTQTEIQTQTEAEAETETVPKHLKATAQVLLTVPQQQKHKQNQKHPSPEKRHCEVAQTHKDEGGENALATHGAIVDRARIEIDIAATTRQASCEIKGRDEQRQQQHFNRRRRRHPATNPADKATNQTNPNPSLSLHFQALSALAKKMQQHQKQDEVRGQEQLHQQDHQLAYRPWQVETSPPVGHPGQVGCALSPLPATMSAAIFAMAATSAAAYQYLGQHYKHYSQSFSFYAASSVILMLCYLTSTSTAAATQSETGALDKHPIFDESSSDKEILDLLLEKKRYDKRLLPPVNGTLTVNVNVLLLSLASPDESSLKYEVEFLLNQQWNDPRLQYGNKSHYDFLNALHHHDSIWTPDTYFIMHGDFKDPIIPMHFALRIFRNGTITYAMRRHLILSCQGSLHIFPFDDPKCSFSMESISYEEAQIKYVWKNDEDTLRKSPSLTTLNAYLIKNQTTACDQNSWRGNYSCLRVDLIFTRDRAFYFTTVFIPGIILVTSSFITFWLEWNAVPARSMIGVTTMLNFFTTSNGFRSTLPVVSNLTAMNVWDGVCMCFIYASLLEFVCVNYVGRKRPLHNVVYRPGENPVTQRLPAVLSRIGVILASPLGEKRRDAGAPNEIVACTTCGGSNSPCTHSANNGCATESCFVQVRKKEPPHPIRVAKTIDVIARITFPTAYAIFLIFFFVHYKGFS
ncbi:glutamate-gated chloride channel isoform X20 [Drosophila ananassae]|uniref:glutamate-gated chloride channel isoform X20 n=1 Tax=Drosophila ananassae TaxID=7217 RepID=UPI001CFF8624|nr:glutamate-gated chloride channel isoform X20 [Drosophila ananassae]